MWEEKVKEIKGLQEKLDRRTEIENEAVSLIEQLEFKKAINVLDALDKPDLSVQ